MAGLPTRLPLGPLVGAVALLSRLKFQAVYLFRRYVLPKDPGDAKTVLVKGYGPGELRDLLLDAGLLKGDYASYYYYGEDLNMVRGTYRDDEYEWYQYHVRGFAVEEGTRLRPHVELYWRKYPREHVRLVNLSVEDGVETTERLLTAADDPVDYEVVPAGGSPRPDGS